MSTQIPLTSSPSPPAGCPHTSSSTPALLFPWTQPEEQRQDVRKLKSRVQNMTWTFVTHFLSCNAQWVVQFFGQVGTLPFNVVSGPGIQGALGHSILHGRHHVSALLPEASRKEREERKHYKTNQTKYGTTPRPHTLLQDPFSQIAKQHQTASKCTTKHNTHVDEAGWWCSRRAGQPLHDWMKLCSVPQY